MGMLEEDCEVAIISYSQDNTMSANYMLLRRIRMYLLVSLAKLEIFFYRHEYLCFLTYYPTELLA